jgi:hypothetical protein
MRPAHVAVVGSGALARSICLALAGAAPPGLRVSVLARDGAAAEEIARDCRARSGGAWNVTGRALHDEVEALADLCPAALVCCASAQSPYERVVAPSPWTDLVARAGFGITLALQATVAVRLARALARVSPQTLFVNGCFPDAVNPLLAVLGLPVHCGIGNVATLAACLQDALGRPDRSRLAVLGHHVHLSAPDDPADEARAWCDGAPVTGVGALLAADRARPRRELNAIAGHAAARLLVALVDRSAVHTSLPGPLGLPGGYPVRLSGREIALDLPPGLSRAEAVAWNLRVGRRDGVEVADGVVRHTPAAAAALAAHLPDLAPGWPVTALDEVTRRLTALRQRLRPAQPAPVETTR